MAATSSWTDIEEKNKKYGNSRSYRMSDFVQVFDKKNYTKKYATFRPVGPIMAVHTHLVKCERQITDAEDKRSKEYMYGAPCIDYDPETGTMKETRNCPYCKIGIPTTVRFYQNAIIRDLEKNFTPNNEQRTASEKTPREVEGVKFFFKESKDSPLKTPIQVIEYPKSLSSKLKEIQDFNFYKDPETGERKNAVLSDINNGVDLLIAYYPDKDVANKYSIMRDADAGKTPISKETRRDYALWDINTFYAEPINEETIIEDFKKSLSKITGAKEDLKEQYIRDNNLKAEKSEKSKPQIKSVSLDDDDLEDDDMTPVQSVGASSNSSSKVSTINEDEFEDL